MADALASNTASSSRKQVLLSWSSGKDCAWTLHVLQHRPNVELVGLLTTFNEAFDRVAMHAVRKKLVEAQAAAAGLPLWEVPLPWPCSNDIYQQRMAEAVARANREGVTHVAFGDLFLEDVRDYRLKMMAGTGIEPIFPIWCGREGTPALAEKMVAAGVRAIITCVDPKQLDPSYVGRTFDGDLLASLPAGVDPCGENGEFHSFCYAGPMFKQPLAVKVGEVVSRDGFQFADVLAA
ncbi:MAG: adenine nucleotide alpha hydrolase [Phycisphaeraceae bacterium]|nr:adenine nucleotide alpha hydrolase [Phycisphaeraceae bacterium]